MKFKIKKYASGGGFMASIYQPITTNSSGATRADIAAALLQGQFGDQPTQQGTSQSKGSTKSSQSTAGQLTEKDLFNKLGSINGLTSDVNAIIQKLQSDLSIRNAMDPLGLVNTNDLANKYLMGLQYINQAKQNKEVYNSAYSTANSKNSLGEAAITQNGQVIVKNSDGDLTSVSVSDYLNNRDKYQLQTNGNLLAERRDNSKYQFNNTLLDVVNNSTSIKEISNTINTLASKISTDANKIGGYTDGVSRGLEIVKAASEKYGINTVIHALGDAGANSQNKVTIFDENSRRQAKMAINAIYQMLPENQRTLLKLRSDGSEKGVYGLISYLVLSKAPGDQFQFDVDLQKDPNATTSKDGSGSSSKGSSSDSSAAVNFALGKGAEIKTQLNTGSPYAITVNARLGAIQDKQGNNLKQGDTWSAVTGSQLGTVLDWNNATFGGSHLSPLSGNHIIINSPEVYSVELPITKDRNGNIVPDLGMAKRMEQVENYIKRYNIQGKDQINAVYQKHQLPAKYGKNGATTPAYKRFAAIQATADEGSLRNPDAILSDAVSVANSQERDMYNEIVTKVLSGDKRDSKYSLSDGWFGIGKDELYRGTIYVPVRDDIVNAATSSGSPFKVALPDDATKVAQMQYHPAQLGYKAPEITLSQLKQ